MSNSFGRLFRITTFGESHGKAVGVVIDGCPARINLDLTVVQQWLDRRRPGQNDSLSSARRELDRVECLSGLVDNTTLGSPITLVVHNTDQRPSDYQPTVLRPSHADYSYLQKYQMMPTSGGGRASASETVGRVAAAGVARQVLQVLVPELEFIGWIDSVENIHCSLTDDQRATVNREQLLLNPLPCPDAEKAQQMVEVIEQARQDGDTVGGCISLLVRNCPSGLGEPVFAKLEAQLAKAMLSIPAVKGFEIGSGFRGTTMRGSQHNDRFITDDDGTITTSTNHSGGVQGGITNGADIFLRVACKPVSTIFQKQQTVDKDGQAVTFKARGRHDPCILPRAVVIIEAMAVLVLLDNFLLNSVSN